MKSTSSEIVMHKNEKKVTIKDIMEKNNKSRRSFTTLEKVEKSL